MNHNSEKYKGIFEESDCLSRERLMQYHNGELTNQEMHEVEHHLLGCDLCSDALEGLSMVRDPDKIDEINRIIQERVRKPASGVKWVAIAAMLLVFIGISTLLYQKLHEADQLENIITEATPLKKDSITPLSEKKGFKFDQVDPKVVKQEIIGEQKTKEESEQPQQIIKEENYTLLSEAEPVEDIEVVGVNEEGIELEVASQEALSVMEEINEETVVFSDELISEDAIASGATVEEEYNIGIEATSVDPEVIEVYKVQVAESQGTRKKSKINNQSTRTTAPESVTNYNYMSESDSLIAEEEILFVKSESEVDNFQIGLDHFKQSKFKKAISHFDKVLQDKSKEKYENAKWFKALALIELQKIKEAKNLLKEIIDDDGEYKIQAEEKVKEI